MGNNIFKAPDDTSQQMADALPQGRAWGSKNIPGSNTRKLIDSLSVAHNRTQQQIELLDDEFRIVQTFDLLEEWEISVGIPDECVGLSETIVQRRQAVIDRLRKKPLVTLQDIQDYIDGLFPGFGVVLIPGAEYYGFEMEFEAGFFGANEKFVLVAEVPLSTDNSFEYEFELTFEGGVDTTQLECLLNKIIPANVYLLINFVGA